MAKSGGSFKKGQSGNPGGRPKEAPEVKALARQYDKEAIETTVEIMRDKKAPHASRLAAATSILDRGYGKPAQFVESEKNVNVNFRSEPVSETDRWIAGLIASGPNSEGKKPLPN